MANLNTDKLKAKLAALLAKTVEAGATEDEAMAAAERAQRLMDEHGITLDDIAASASDRAMFDHFSTFTTGARLDVVAKYSMMAIAEFCDVRCWVSSKERFDGVRTVKARGEHFAGYAADVEHAKFLLALVKEAAEYECKLWARLHGKTTARDRDDFKVAFAARVAKRLRDMKAAEVVERAASVKAGTALVVAKERAVSDYLSKDLKINLSTGRGRSRSYRNEDAYRAGSAAGDRVGLHRGVTGGGSARRAIGC